MSLPRQVSSHSSSPSKSSLRHTSGPSNPSPRNPTLLPSPHFDDHHHPATTHHSPQPEAFESYNEHANASSIQPAPPTFQPFFILIEDPITHEHHHPTVHYIFADDDPDIITDAACRSLEDTQDYAPPYATTSASTTDDRDSQSLHPPVAEVKEHYLVLDVQPTATATSTRSVQIQHAESTSTSTAPLPLPLPPPAAYEVTQAHSLSSEWQVLRTKITQAPTIGDSPEDEGLMLRVEGRGNTPPDTMAQGEDEKQSLEEMIERFQRRLEDVRLVVDGNGVGKQG